MVKSFFIILIKYLVARPRTFTKGRQLEVQNKLLLDDLFDYPLYELTIIFFSVSIFHHGLIITLLSKSLLVQYCDKPKFKTYYWSSFCQWIKQFWFTHHHLQGFRSNPNPLKGY